MIRHDSLELLLYAASGDCMMASAAEFHAIDASDVTPSPRVLRRLHRLMHRKKPRLFIRVLWSAVLLLLALSLTVYAAVPQVRESIRQMRLEFEEKIFKIHITDSTIDDTSLRPIDPPTKIERVAALTYIPAGCYFKRASHYRTGCYTEYVDKDGKLAFSFSQSTLGGDRSVDNEDVEIRTVMVREYEGILVTHTDRVADYMLIWMDHSYYYFISGHFEDLNELMRIAEGVVLP